MAGSERSRLEQSIKETVDDLCKVRPPLDVLRKVDEWLDDVLSNETGDEDA